MSKRVSESAGWPNFGIFHTRGWRGKWKALTYVISMGAAYYMVFHVDFEMGDKPNVFTGIRKMHDNAIDSFFGIKQEKD